MSDCSYQSLATRPARTVSGEDLVWYFQVKDPCGNVVDITGKTFAAYAKDIDDATNVITITNASFALTDPTNGKGKFTIPRATTVSQGGKQFIIEIWILDINDAVDRGSWIVELAVRPIS